MKYAPLFHIALDHGYYAGLACPDAELLPDVQTMKVFKSYRLLTRPSAQGLSVLCPLSNGKPLIDVSSAVFRFRMVLRSSAFYHYTDMSSFPDGCVPVFVNNGLNSALSLKEGECGDPSGLADIHIEKISFSDKAASFVLRLEAKSVRWKYVLITDELSTDRFAIVQSRSLRDDEPVKFKAPVTAGKGLSIMDLIQSGFPEASKVLIESQNEVRCSHEGRRYLQLKKDNVVLLDHLPNPAPGEEGIKVIKYFKTPNH